MVSPSLLLTVVGEDIREGRWARRLSSRPDLLSLSRDSSGGCHYMANSILNKGDIFSKDLV